MELSRMEPPASGIVGRAARRTEAHGLQKPDSRQERNVKWRGPSAGALARCCSSLFSHRPLTRRLSAPAVGHEEADTREQPLTKAQGQQPRNAVARHTPTPT